MSRPANQVAHGSHLSAPVAFPLGGRGNSHPSIPDHSPVPAQFQHGILNDAADQSGTVVMIGVGGGVSLPFLFFHAPRTGEEIAPSQAQHKRCP